MATSESNGLLDVIRGGQIVKHYIQMFKQVFWYAFGFGNFFFIAIFCAYMLFTWQKVEAISFWNWIQAWYLTDWLEKGHKMMYYMTHDGEGFSAKAAMVYMDEATNYYADKFIAKLKLAGLFGAGAFVVLVAVLIRVFTSKGRDQVMDEKLRGNELVDKKVLIKLLKDLAKKVKDYKPGKIVIDGIKIPSSFEPQGFAVFGAPGSGKTQLYGEFFEKIRADKRRAIVNDRSGTLLEKFYQPGDIILNPIDVRCAPWSLFNECHHKHDFDRIAAILFPSQNGDPFWYEAPRQVFVALAMKEAKRPKPSLHRLTKKILTCDVQELVDLCQNTLAQALIDKDVIRQTNSLRGVIVTKLQGFLLFEDHKAQGFSIRDWVTSEDHSGCIFITSNKDQEATLKPLITCWLELASSSILSLPPLLTRRIWLLYDELHTLDKVESLASTLAEVRKYGGCGLIGFQGYKQAVEIYGQNGVEGLIDSCSTGIYMRQNTEASAKFAAAQMGKKDLIEATSQLSYGASSVRDGQNHGHQRYLREVVLPSEVQGLPDLWGYLRFGRGLPVVQFKLKYKDRPSVAEGFIEDKDKLLRLDRIVTDPKGLNDLSDDPADESEAHDLATQRDKEKDDDLLASFDAPMVGMEMPNTLDQKQNDEMQQWANTPLPLDDRDMPDGR